MVGEVRINNGRNEHTRFIVIDSQSVKNTDTAKNKGYDAGKKVSGIKRHLVVDSQGLPHGMLVTTANCTDRQGALDVIRQNQATLKQAEDAILIDTSNLTIDEVVEKISKLIIERLEKNGKF